jgi:hypothetical protein
LLSAWERHIWSAVPKRIALFLPRVGSDRVSPIEIAITRGCTR